jgi:phosphoribosyl 1,2-cyclic phosphodiesterase
MVRFTVLASGSKGNSAVVTCLSGSGGSTRILVDAGLSCRELFRRMRMAGEDPSTLDAILITHEHQDHVNGLAVTARKLGIPVYFTEATHRAWVRQVTPQKRVSYAEWAAQYAAKKRMNGPHPPPFPGPAPDPSPDPEPVPDPNPIPEPMPMVAAQELGQEPGQEDGGLCHFTPDPRTAEAQEAASPAPDPARLPSVAYFRAGEAFSIGDVQISPFTIPHDAADPVGFVFTAEGVRLAVATDLGYMPPNVQAQLRRCDLIMLESNHDLEMLRDGPYPWSVKQRVLSRVGHLSNTATAAYLEQSYDGSAAYLILAHLSESNNLPDLARIAAERALVSKPSLLGNRLFLAAQHEPMAPVCF